MSTPRKYSCPWCKRSRTRDQLPGHIERNHMDMLPEGFTPLRATFHIVNKKPWDYTRPCRICGGATDWDEHKGRYNFLCNKKSCHDAWVQHMHEMMGDKEGSNRPTATKEGLEKMLAARKISGKYKFKDGGEKSYVGSYEKETLKFMDQVLEVKSEDVMTPGPVLEYQYEGKKHYYIPDIMYIPYNLIIEVKDGGKNPNNNKAMSEVRKRSLAKEKFIIDHTDYNYLKLTDKDFSQLLYVFADLKMHMIEDNKERVIHVNENTDVVNESKPITDKICQLLQEISQKDKRSNKVLAPIFIINTYTGTTMGRVMKDFLNMQYSHALISTDPELKTMYSYDGVGLHKDTLDNYRKAQNGIMRVIAVFVSPRTKATIENSFEYYMKNKKKTHYNIIGLFDLLNGSNKINSYGDFTLFCSEFVDSVLKNAKIDITGKSSRNTAPDDFGKFTAKNNVFKLFEGEIKDYDGSKIKGLIKNLKSHTTYAKLRATTANSMTSVNDINLGRKNYWPVIGQQIFRGFTHEDGGGIPAGCGTMDGVIVVNYLQNNVFAKPEYGVADNLKLDNIVTTAGDKVLNKETVDILKNSRYSVYFVECDSKKIYDILAENLHKPVPNYFIYHTIFGHKPYTNDQIVFENNCHKIKDYYSMLDEASKDIRSYILYDISTEEEDDKQIMDKWFVKSPDNAINCCLKIRGYDKPMRGRSSMLILRRSVVNWQVFLKKDDDKGHEYHAPGGGWNPDETPMEAAIRESREEARINVSDVSYGGTLIEYHTKVADWVKQNIPEDEWWYGYYTRIFVGTYQSTYSGHIDEIDKDPEILSGEWYNVDDVISKINPEYANAISHYIDSKDRNEALKPVRESTDFFNESLSRDTSKSKDIQTIIDLLSPSDRSKLNYSRQDHKFNDSKTVKEIVDYDKGFPVAYFVVDMQKDYSADVSLAVRSDYQGKGYGSKVAKEGTAWVKSHLKEFTEVFWATKANNKGSQVLAEKNGWKVVRDDEDWKTYSLKGTKKPINESVSGASKTIIKEDVDTSTENKSLSKYNMIIIGEIHNTKMISFYDKLLTKIKPKYFICEFADEDRCLSGKELKDRIDNATDGDANSTGADKQYNYWCYELALKHHCKLIGCNPTHIQHYDKMDDEDKVREAYMLKVLKEFEHDKCVVQLGDHHLRSIPITKEFIEFCGNKNKDARGVSKDVTTSNASPIFEYFVNKPNVLIVRNPSNYKKEVEFSKSLNESAIINRDDILYNKDKFDSGVINLCFITGLSGSGKSTMGRDMQNDMIEVYQTDDLEAQWNFSDANLKEYGGLIYSFFMGPGKKYRLAQKDAMKLSEHDYEEPLVKDFVAYTKSYSKSHKDKKYVIEGVALFVYMKPQDFADYAFYIKGTSALMSAIRSAKRDATYDNGSDKKNPLGTRIKSFIKITTKKGRWKAYLNSDKKLDEFRRYFESKVK